MTLALPATDRDAATRRPSTRAVGVLGLGTALPDHVVTNDDLAARMDTSDAWIRRRTGIAERRFVAEGEATSDLAIRAARAALADAAVDVADVGHVVVATSTPDHLVAPTAPAVAAALGTRAAAVDLGAACAGFLYALRVAAGLLATDDAPVLVVGADCLSRSVDPDDREVAVLFGDGAGAVVLGAGGPGDLGPFDLGSDGTDPSCLWVEAGGSRLPSTASTLDGRHRLTMRGAEVYRQAIAAMTTSSQRVLDAAGITVDEVDLVVGHQANARILTGVADRLGVPHDRLHLTVDRHGNTSAASIPLALADARDNGRLHDGDRLLLTAFGAGLTWGSCLLTWTEEPS